MRIKNSAAIASAGAALVAQLRTTKPVGRLVIGLPALPTLGKLSRSDVVQWRSYRVLSQMQEVTVIGEVQNPTSHL